MRGWPRVRVWPLAVWAVLAVLVAGCATPQAPAPSPTAAAAPTSSATGDGCTASPRMTMGPYYVAARERSNVTGDSGATTAEADDEYTDASERAGLAADAGGPAQPGTPLRLTVTVDTLVAGVCAPMVGAQVDVWHANAQGQYSGVNDPGFDTVGHDWLRGWQRTDGLGQVHFDTIWPGWYHGRAVHIHVRVRAAGTDFTSQFFFDDAANQRVLGADGAYTAGGKSSTPDTPNAADGIYRGGGDQMLLVTRTQDGGYAASKTIVAT